MMEKKKEDRRCGGEVFVADQNTLVGRAGTRLQEPQPNQATPSFACSSKSHSPFESDLLLNMKGAGEVEEVEQALCVTLSVSLLMMCPNLRIVS